MFILTVTIYRVEFKGENNEQVNISKNAFRSIKYRWSTRQSSTFFQGFLKFQLYIICVNQYHPQAALGIMKCCVTVGNFFKNVFLLAHCMNRFPNSADLKDDWKVILRGLTDKC